MTYHSHQQLSNSISSQQYRYSHIGPRKVHGSSFRIYSFRIFLFIHTFASIRNSGTDIPVFAVSDSLWPNQIIFHLPLRTFIIIQCSCLGASLCYLMSNTLAKQLVVRKFSTLFMKFNKMVQNNHHKLFWYMLFLRFTPLIPNWFVNLASPLVGIPYHYFLVGSFIGLMPMNFILMQTGETLK
jgi:membrane protein YqaA with SNARE-associated domain